MALMAPPAHPCLDPIPISHYQGLVQGTAHNWGLQERNHRESGHVFPVVFTWFCSVNPDKGEGRGKEVLLDPARSTFISNDASAAHS